MGTLDKIETTMVYVMIGVMCILIWYSISIRYTNTTNIIEGAVGSYQEQNLDDDPVYIAKINAANIAYLKEQIDTVSDLKREINEMKEQVDSNSYAVQSLNTSMQNTATDSIPDEKTTQNLANTGAANATVS